MSPSGRKQSVTRMSHSGSTAHAINLATSFAVLPLAPLHRATLASLNDQLKVAMTQSSGGQLQSGEVVW
ncbi:conserved hypothetical protein [Ricinus communis]|uniref:Uncharacterized protein n=1 Tax=Ricinus communis TaxID=3988 RepID=B9TEF4_RICCO|nr:conserved hypothetical protein [Ricinus communis]